MKKVLKIFWILAFAVLLSVPAYSETGTIRISINANPFQDEVYVFMNHYGNFYSERATNVDLEFYSDNIEIYLEMFIPNGNDRLIAGTYNVSRAEDEDHMPFTFSYGAIGLNQNGYYEVTGGTMTVRSSGTGNNLEYNISFNFNIEDEDGLSGTMTGDFQGTFEWEDYS